MAAESLPIRPEVRLPTALSIVLTWQQWQIVGICLTHFRPDIMIEVRSKELAPLQKAFLAKQNASGQASAFPTANKNVTEHPMAKPVIGNTRRSYQTKHFH